jgi:predicted nucleic acid-binding protein
MARTVCLDSNIVIWGILGQGKAGDESKRQKVAHLLDVLQQQKDRVLIPSIVLAEVAAKMPPPDRIRMISRLSSACEIVPFDAGSALEFGVVRSFGMKMKSREFPRRDGCGNVDAGGVLI